MPKPILLTESDYPILNVAPCPVQVIRYAELPRLVDRLKPQVAIVDDPDQREYLELALADVPKVWALDDCGDVTSFRLDGLVNGHPAGPTLAYRIKGTTLLGPRYALLRTHFGEYRPAKPKSGPVGRIMVCLGGSSAAMGMVPELARDVRALLDVEVVVYGGTQDELPQFGPHTRTWDYAEAARLMRGTDLAICTASMGCLELLCMGVPTLTYTVSTDQEVVQRGLTHLAPVYTLETLLALVRDTPWRSRLSEQGMDTVDGLGAERVAEAILAP